MAATLALALMAPTGAAFASPESDVAARAHTRREHRQFDHPTVTIDRVYAGSAEGAVGTHVWNGDVFGTGTSTAVTYVVEMGIDGVPILTSVAVDESTLPEGVTYSVREGTVSTRTDDGERRGEDAKGDDGDDPTEDGPADHETTASTVNASTTQTTTADDEDATDDSTTDDESMDESDQGTTWFSGRAGVRFAMGERWAGLLILLNGAVGDESAAHLKTILVTPPANGRDDQEAEDTDASDVDVRTDETVPDRHKDPGRKIDESKRKDRSEDRGNDRSDRREDNNGHDDRGSDSHDHGSRGNAGGRGNG